MDEEAAINVKNEALRNLKERLLTRAEIIQRRLEEEQKNLETAYVRITLNNLLNRLILSVKVIILLLRMKLNMKRRLAKPISE